MWHISYIHTYVVIYVRMPAFKMHMVKAELIIKGIRYFCLAKYVCTIPFAYMYIHNVCCHLQHTTIRPPLFQIYLIFLIAFFVFPFGQFPLWLNCQIQLQFQLPRNLCFESCTLFVGL